MFSNLLYTLLGDCFFTSRRNAENFSKSLRSMSAKYIFGQDSWKYFRAVEYAAYVFGFFVSLVSRWLGTTMVVLRIIEVLGQFYLKFGKDALTWPGVSKAKAVFLILP